MNMNKIIPIGEYLYMVDEDFLTKDLKQEHWVYARATGSIQRYRNRVDGSFHDLIIASNNPDLGLPLLPLPDEQEDMIALVEGRKHYPVDDVNNNLALGGFIRGYKAAKAKGQYSEGDMRKAIELARDISEGKDTFTAEDIAGCTEVCTYGWKFKYSDKDILKSLQPPPIGCEIEWKTTLKKPWEDGLLNKSEPKTEIIDGKTYVIVKKWIYE